jgi:cytochrome bd-type quinol oxidase subunit 2
MIEDRELDAWREQWTSVAKPSATFQRDFQRKVQQRIKRHNQRFVLGNILTAIVFLGILIFAFYMRHQATWMGPGWAISICVLVFVAVSLRIWVLRRTWRPETQSTRAFVELWHKRVEARIRLLRISTYLSIGWLIFCAALMALNWPIIGQDFRAHPKSWIVLLVVCVLMQPVMLWYGAGWLRRRKQAELHEVNQILNEMDA